MTKLCSTLLVSATLLAALSSDISGTWNMGLQGDHVIPTALVLKQDGTSITGTIAIPVRVGERVEVPLTGELKGAALKLSGQMETAKEPMTIEIAGELKDDGSMEGTLVTHGHNLTWTAERLRERKR
jgi:hypothetical protein